jgi:hypothetical protein
MTTLRQIEANRRNSLLSTGPRTPQGKEQSRRNALKHGLAGAGIVLPEDEAEAVAERQEQWHSALRPWNPYEEWLCEEIVVASIQIDRGRTEEALLRTELAERAGTSWDDDRRLAAEVLGSGLAKKPALVSRQLQQTTQGCAWLLERWEALGRTLDANGDWTAAQKTLALDLLGTPSELRDGPTRLDPPPGSGASSPQAYRAALVAGEIQRLKDAQETVLEARDAREQLAAELGLDADAPRPLALLRRYLTACRRRFTWALNQLQRGKSLRSRPTTTTPPAPAPSPSPSPAPAPAPPPLDARLVEEAEEDADELFGLDPSVLGAIDPALLTDRRLLTERLGLRASAPDAAPASESAPASSATPRSVPSSAVMPPSNASPFGNRRTRRTWISQARRG